ncbi:right-handed parallel beta-helix repeat-containing protein [Synoicihabitans lomoniglobus]|uniref:Right-handed parallel beta-helix repeat-containing protein n=1 Tax=Synoicihabitans lomoniglobus TaxID=2909285 RepID=A0AAF0I442_9BACT|nr:right-handed parallel beta-helix repeat-containing protein [Opitutaceae bacterium LMO-M01]WED66539.1 right-handed parallel beta-helix repeat-containing protein [Opitutaceae bacterium LMO-M01]
MRRFPLFVYAVLLALPLISSAAPSGGPYGPIQQTYALPQVEGTIYYVSPEGDAAAAGTKLSAPTTIETAIERVVTGDAIVLRGGTYRTGNLVFNQGITLQPYADEQPILKGTKVVTPEAAYKQRNGLYRIKWDTLFYLPPQPWWRRESSGNKTPLWLFNNDMVFVDGKALKTVGWEGDVEPGSFSVDYEHGNIYIDVDPAEHLVEITTFDNAFTRTTKEVHGKSNDGVGPIFRGLTMTQYAYRAIEIEGYDPEKISAESEHGKDIVGTTLEHCTITHCSRVAGYFRGDNMVFRHNLISDTSTEGIFILASNDTLLEKNIFRRNNVEGIEGYFPAAVKIFNQTRRVVVRDNLLYDNPGSNGIWYDVGNIDGVFINNWIQDSYNGFFFEISKGVTVAGNVFVNSGSWVLNSSGAKFYNNTYVNSIMRITRTPRSAQGDHFDWHPASGPDVDERFGHVARNNLFFSDGGLLEAHNMVSVTQEAELVDRLKNQTATFDHNAYVRTSAGPTELITWSPVATESGQATYATLGDLQDVVETVDPNGVELSDYDGPIFRSMQLQRYDLSPAFPAATAAGTIPGDVAELIGLDPAAGGAPGAYGTW